MYKMKLFLVVVVFGTNTYAHMQAQEYDTIYHTCAAHEKFVFYLADTSTTSYKVSAIDLDTVDGDTTDYTIKTDTFFVKRLEDVEGEVYEYWMSDSTWLREILRSECSSYYNQINAIPKFILKWDNKTQDYLFDNCEENYPLLEEAYKVKIDCLKALDEISYIKYAERDMESTKDCATQTRFFLSDLGHITAQKNFPIPINVTIKFSIVDNADTTGLMNVHYYCQKEIAAGHTKITLGEDVEKADSVSSKFQTGLYSAFKDMLSPEEQQRDSIRIASMKDFDKATMIVDKNLQFRTYERYPYHSVLEKDLKSRSKSEYWHIIERIKQ